MAIVDLMVFTRDEEGNISGAASAIGTTTNGGATVVIPNGYVPYVTTVAPSDILLRLPQEPIVVSVAGVISRVDDAEADTSTLTFALSE